MADFLNKMIGISTSRKTDTLPHEAVHFVVELGKKNNKDISGILKNIKQWDGYEEIRNLYSDKDEETIDREAATALIAKYYEKGLDKNPLSDKAKVIAKTIIRNIVNLWNELAKKLDLKEWKNINAELNDRAEHVAQSILSEDYKSCLAYLQKMLLNLKRKELL